MHKSLENWITSLEERSKRGLHLHTYQVLQALRFKKVQSELSKIFNSGWSLKDAVRVYYTQNPSWVEVLFRLTPPSEKIIINSPAILVTFFGDIIELVSITDIIEEPSSLSPEGETLLPFAMHIPSESVNVIASEDDPILIEINERREEYTAQIIREEKDGSTSSCVGSSHQTCRSSRKTTYYTSQIPSTGRPSNLDNDNKQDSKTDRVEDCRIDSFADWRND